ncbi:MAG: class I SAM-dependent methyltransferase [bacterium]|nr:class I SAM-dependent methyltransferase [bacterium]
MDFDEHAEKYDDLLMEKLAFFEGDDAYFASYKARIVRDLIRTEPESILEFGCGTGRNITAMRELFPGARLAGCDISAKSLEVAAKRCPYAEFFQLLSDEGPVPNRYDLIFVANVFHHIHPDKRSREAASMTRMLNGGGELFFFEHNPYNPVTRRIVSTCPLDKDAVLIRPGEASDLLGSAGLVVHRRSYTLFLPAALSFLRPLEHLLGWLPLGGQYFLHGVLPDGRINSDAR